MANCSFIKATDARTRARNDTLIWTEICELQAAILAAIDNNEYSTIVTDGTPFTTLGAITGFDTLVGGNNYNIVAPTATIDANGTGGVGATLGTVAQTNGIITSIPVTAGGSGYAPVDPIATLLVPYSLTNAQDETSYNGVGTEGTFAPGIDYFVGEVITLSNSTGITIDAIDAGLQRYVIQSAQDETSYDNSPATEGTFNGGAGYSNSDSITLNDGTVVTVDLVAAGVVTEFTVASGSTASSASTGLTRVQQSTTGNGTGFTLTPDVDNETLVGPATQFTVDSLSSTVFFLTQTLQQTSTTGIGTAFSLSANSGNATAVPHAGSEAVLTPLFSGGAITGVVVNDGGTGYTDQNPITFTVGANASAVANVTGGVIQSVTVVSGGTGYETKNPLVTVTHPLGQDFAGTVNVSAGTTAVFRVDITAGAVTAVTVADGGSGYTDGTGFTFLLATTAGGGDGLAEITYDVTNGVINNPSVSVAGATYTSGSNVRVAAADTPEPLGAITSISVQNGGTLYTSLYPTITVSDATGSGAEINVTGVSGGAITSLQIADGGSGYSQTPVATFAPATTGTGSGASVNLTVQANAYGTNPLDYYAVLSGQATDAVIADQIQYVLDYFTALGYNIRAQVNPATANTLQWQIIW